ncbi:hypothetical protein TIFTF001_017270 [Ficus carica]|uniref:Uncharacterized protein n=1 Tax=Ficus carica TaxID=3494 RepID=A0AA88A7R7_FICCA|nr:hypothetical protein TIFTF001_017270 [Ficus carica]
MAILSIVISRSALPLSRSRHISHSSPLPFLTFVLGEFWITDRVSELATTPVINLVGVRITDNSIFVCSVLSRRGFPSDLIESDPIAKIRIWSKLYLRNAGEQQIHPRDRSRLWRATYPSSRSVVIPAQIHPRDCDDRRTVPQVHISCLL